MVKNSHVNILIKKNLLHDFVYSLMAESTSTSEAMLEDILAVLGCWATGSME